MASDLKGKISPLIYLAGMACAWFLPAWTGMAFFVLAALIWFVPDRRMERAIRARERRSGIRPAFFAGGVIRCRAASEPAGYSSQSEGEVAADRDHHDRFDATNERAWSMVATFGDSRHPCADLAEGLVARSSSGSRRGVMATWGNSAVSGGPRDRRPATVECDEAARPRERKR